MEKQSGGVLKIIHNVAEHRFEAIVDGHLCVAEYELRAGTITFTHTFVPNGLRGRGIAAKLVQRALEYARDQNLAIVPACSYVAVYIERHQEFKSLVA